MKHNMIGLRCGMLTVIKKASRPADYTGQVRGSWWECRCECGKTRIAPRQYLTSKTISSCGCVKRAPREDIQPHQKTLEEIKEDKARAGRARAEQLRGEVTNFRMPGSEKLQINSEDRKMLDTVGRQCLCAECGKPFERLSYDWVYKSRTYHGRIKWYCSYTCWRAEDKKPKRPHGNSMAARANI